MNASKPSYVCVVSQPFAENTYLVWGPNSPNCVVVDPGLEPGKTLAALHRERREPEAILITHGHSDHIAGIGDLIERWPDLPIIIGVDDADKLVDPEKNLSAPFGFPIVCPPATQLVREGDRLTFAGLNWEVRDTPGHSCGHVVFICGDAQQPVVLGGDVLFQGSVGRTDFPDGDFAQLRNSIHQKLFTLPDNALILPGHGPSTTVGEEKQSNPYVALRA